MTDYSKLFKRTQALILVAAMMLSVLNVAFWPGLFADAAEKKLETKTDGEILAENYELTDAEKKLLNSNYLVEEVHTYTKPDGSDGLIAVDTDSKTVTAKAYKSGDYTWIPVSATIVVGNETKETLALSDADPCTATYSYDGNAFSVKVDYEVTVTIDTDKQQALLDAPAVLKQGVANLDALMGADAKLLLIAQAVPSLVDLANGIEITVTLFGQQVKGEVSFDSTAAKEAVAALNEQYTANGELLALNVLAKEYAAVPKTQFLVDKGSETLEALNTLRSLIRTIHDDKVWTNEVLMEGLESTQPTTYTLLNALLTTMTEWLAVADEVAADPWTALTADCVAEGADYDALDLLVGALGETSSVTVKNPLTLDTTSIQFNMSMWNVTIEVVLKTVDKVDDSAALVTTKSATTVLTYADGTAKSEIEADAAAFAAGELANWDAYVDDKYDVSCSALSDALSEDTVYTITYSPKNYDITLSYADTMTVPYGYRYTLPVATEEGTDYDYYVDGVYYAEGRVVVITDNTSIERTLGKAYTTEATNSLVADRYFANNAKASAILTSGALTVGNETISVRYPEKSDQLVTISGNTLTAKTYNASYNNLVWVPDTYTVVNGDEETAHNFDGANEVTITETVYDRVDVVYRLALDVDVLDLVNLPDVLADEAADQKAVLDRLSNPDGNIYKNLGQLDAVKLSALNGVIGAVTLNADDPEKDAELKAYFQGVVGDMIAGLDTNSQFKLYNLLTNYQSANGGLAYYYRNSEAFLTEIASLSSALSAMLADEEKEEALTTLVSAAGFPEYADKIASLESEMATLKEALTAPHAAIDVNSPNLDKLVAALTMEGTTESYDSLPTAFALESAEISITADNKVTISDVAVKIDGGKTVKVPNKTYNKGHLLTAEDVQAWIEAIDAAIAELNVSDDFYTNNYNSAVLEDLVGESVETLAKNLKELDLTWSAKEFTVHIDGSADQTISVNDLTVQLPASPDSTYRYDYLIDGKVYTEKYTFTKEEVVALFVNGEYTVTLVKVNVAREELINLVNTLNESADDTVVFALVENGDKYSIVMKVNAANTGALMGSVQNVAMGFVNSGYMIGLDNEKLIYTNDNNELKVSLQSVVDAVMNSGFGTDTVLSVIDANGKINNMTLGGTVISAETIGTLGGELVKTTMQFTKGASNFDLPFYITLGSAPAALTTVRNALAGQVGNYVDVTCTNGSANVALTLPGKAYEAYLAVLLATDNIDLSDIDAVNAEIAIGFVKDVIDPLLAGDANTTTFKNTLAKLGYNLNLEAYEAYYTYFKNFYNACEFTYDTDSLSASGVIRIKGLVDRMDLGVLGSMIAEYETGLTVSADFALTNIATTEDYEAIYVDVYASGVTNKAGITKDLSAKLSTMAGTALVVLTDNVDGNLTFNTTTVLNLNGFTVTGDVVANGNLTIIDTTAADGVCGGVDGNLSGNVTVLAGAYTDDVTAFVKNGYAVTDGVVDNIFYDIVKDGDVITVTIDAGVLNIDSVPSVRDLAIDLLADLAFNGYTANSLYVDGNKVYDITVEDLLGLYAGTDRLDAAVNKLVGMFDVAQLDDVINGIIAALTDFEAIESAISNDAPLYSASATVGAWALEVEHVLDGDYITANLASHNTKDLTLNLVIGGSEEDKAALAALAGELAAITNELTVKVEMNQALTDKTFTVDVSGSAVVDMDLSAPKYTVMIGILAADALGGKTAEAIVDGIEYYYTSGNMKPLMDAVKALTTAQVISTVKALGMDDDFVAMIESLGLTDVVKANVVELEAAYDSVAKLGAALLRRTSITGGNTALGNYFKTEGTLDGGRENIERTISRTLRGYTLTVNLEATTLYLSVKLFGDEVPEIEEPTIEVPTVGESNKVNQVIVEDGVIYLDLDKNGITLDELKALLGFAYDAENFEVTYSITDGLVVNGTTVTAVATNGYGDYTKTAEVTYTIIVLGDVNADGMNTPEDVSAITDYLLYYSLNGVNETAADINMDGWIDIRDAYLATKKDADNGDDLPANA